MGGIYTFPGSREGRVNRAFEGRAGEKKSGAMASLRSFRSSERSDWVVPSTFASVLGQVIQVIKWPAEWCTGMEHVDTFMSAWESGGGSQRWRALTCILVRYTISSRPEDYVYSFMSGWSVYVASCDHSHKYLASMT